MPDEKPAPLPLTGEEVQNAILFKVQESLQKTCHLKYDNAYTSFKADISVKLVLSDYGREVRDNHNVSMEIHTDADAPNPPSTFESNVTMEPAPPNQVRVETEQPVPVVSVEGGKRTVKHLRYAPRKSKIGQEVKTDGN